MNFSLFVRESNCTASEDFKCNTQAVLTTCMILLLAIHIHYFFIDTWIINSIILSVEGSRQKLIGKGQTDLLQLVFVWRIAMKCARKYY